MQIELWRNVKIVDTSATATKRLIKMIAVGLVTAILLATQIGHTKQMDNIFNNAGNIEQGQGFAYILHPRHRVQPGRHAARDGLDGSHRVGARRDHGRAAGAVPGRAR